MDNFLAYLLMAAITLPLSFFLARGCLRGVVRFMSGASGAARRDVL
jgi:hypothetical protein